MGVAQLNNRIAVVNAAVKRLDNERQVNIGKREQLHTQLSQALDAYKAEFGVALSLDNLQEEIDKVVAAKESEVTTIESALALISQNQFAEAEKLLGVVPVKEEPVGEVTPEGGRVLQGAETLVGEFSSVADFAGIPKDAFTVHATSVPEAGIPAAPQKLSGVSSLVGAEAVDVGDGFSMPDDVHEEVENVVSPPPAVGAPPSLGKPPVSPASTVKKKPPMSFSAIAGGTKFNP